MFIQWSITALKLLTDVASTMSLDNEFQIFESERQMETQENNFYSAEEHDSLSSSSDSEHEQTCMDYVDSIVADYNSADDFSFMSPTRHPISEEYTTDTSASNNSDVDDHDHRQNTTIHLKGNEHGQHLNSDESWSTNASQPLDDALITNSKVRI